MARKNCKQPGDCVAAAKGPCRVCSDLSAVRSLSSEKMRKLHADPKFAAANAERASERMRRRHADPMFAAANAERMRKRQANPKFVAAYKHGQREFYANRHRALGLTEDYQVEAFRIARKSGCTEGEAVAIALREKPRQQAAE